MTKPGITAVVVMTVLCGFLLASPLGSLDGSVLLHAMFGAALVSAGAGTLNMLLEIGPDSLMSSTQDRPLPRERLRPETAFVLGTLSSSIGIVHLALSVNMMSGFISAMSLALYLVFYTPAKKVSSICTVVGAVSGALPILIGWSAAAGSVNVNGFTLFLILFVWQFPHLLALSWMYRRDYSKAGFKMMPVEDSGGSLTGKFTLGASVILLLVSVLPFWLGLSGLFYFLGAMFLGMVCIKRSFDFFVQKNETSAKRLFLYTILYIPLLLILMVVGR